MRLVCGESKIFSPCHCRRILLIALALQCSTLMTVGIEISNFSIPAVGIIGQSATLECYERLESDKLYSLQWYKDGHTFYRYFPYSRPTVSAFNASGVQANNLELHNKNRITLRNLSLNSTGVYKCEVSSESPAFQTKFVESTLTVIIPPNPLNPRLSKFPQTVYMSRDILDGNCTSYRSYPSANLTFYINDIKWTGSNVTVYEPVSEIGWEGHEVWTSVLGLRVRVEYNLFQKGAIRIKCVASILGHEFETKKSITHHNYQPPLSSSGRNQYSSASAAFKSRVWWWNNWTFTLSSLTFPMLRLFTLILQNDNALFYYHN